MNVINPRIGIVHSRNGGALDKMLPIFSVGLGGVIGNGKQWMSWIHLEDLTNMFSHFVKNPKSKKWHHTHEFEDFAGRTLMRDRVLYQLPLGRIGQLLSGPSVKSNVLKNFSFRKKYIAQIFY